MSLLELRLILTMNNRHVDKQNTAVSTDALRVNIFHREEIGEYVTKLLQACRTDWSVNRYR